MGGQGQVTVDDLNYGHCYVSLVQIGCRLQYL